MTFRADAAFAKPEIYEALEDRGVDYVIRIPANKNLELEIEEILFRPPGRPSLKPLVDCRRVTLSMERASIQYALSKRTVRVEPTATR